MENIISVGELLYKAINPNSKMDVPSYFFEKIEVYHKKWEQFKTDNSFFEYCLKESDLLNKFDLYITDWVGFEKVLKRLSDDFTILYKENNLWYWYNKNITKEQYKLITNLFDVSNGYFEN